jgi:hypothetical protein
METSFSFVQFVMLTLYLQAVLGDQRDKIGVHFKSNSWEGYITAVRCLRVHFLCSG